MRQLSIPPLLLSLLLSLVAFLDSTSAAPNVCQSPECLTLSAFITSSMNSSADPCEDFEKYACGNYKVNNLYDPRSVKWSGDGDQLILSVRGLDKVSKELSKRIFELLLFPNSLKEQDPDIAAMNQLAGNLFRSCASWQQRKRNPRRNAEENERETSSVVLNGILEHLVESFDPKTQVGWFERAIAKMVRFGSWPFLEIEPSLDLRFSKGNISPNITRVRLTYNITKQGFPASATKNFSKFLGSLPSSSGFNFSALDSFLKIHSELNGVVIESANDSIKLLRWAKCPEAKLLSQPGNLATDLTINNLNKISKCADDKNPFDWSVFFDGVLDGSVNKNNRIQFGTRGKAIDIIKLVTYFKRNSISGSRSSKFNDHFAYLTLDWMTKFLPFYSWTLAKSLDAPYILLPIKGEDPINECIMLTKLLLSPIVERMHLHSRHNGTLDRVRRLVDLIQNATIMSVRKQAWITPASKDAIIDKITSLKKAVGFDNVPDSKLKAFYASTARSLKKSNNSNSYQNFGLLLSHAMCASAGRRNNLLSSSGDVLTSSFEIKDSLTVNAFSALRKNEIIFPIGILSPTIYHRSYPEHINLGGIGVVIGHEIGHGFDEVGHELTKIGTRGHFWDNETEAGYLERLKCVKSRYGSYEMVPGLLHNSSLTVGNDIADLMGLQAGYGAMNLLSEQDRLLRLPNLPESLTTEKLFFIQAAQTWCDKTEANALVEIYKRSQHSPSHLRIRGMMENSKEFAAVFKCKTGQAMNPRNKCDFW